MIEIENKNFLELAATKMGAISSLYCNQTTCDDERMKSVSEEDNCEWYHSGWLYCRLCGIVVSEDYLGAEYSNFFNSIQTKEIKILVCGLADYVVLAHVLRRIPASIANRVSIDVVDICNSPLKLCEWYVQENPSFKPFSRKIHYIKADAAQLPFKDEQFDLITSYSFLTRMVFSESTKIVHEWHRVLKQNGIILTTIHVTDGDNEGQFYHTNTNDLLWKKKLESYLSETKIGGEEAKQVREKVSRYMNNIMSCSISLPSVKKLFADFDLKLKPFDQPGELVPIHKMLSIYALKH